MTGGISFFPKRIDEHKMCFVYCGPERCNCGAGNISKAIERAKVFDDGSDGADSESAQSVIALLTPVLEAADKDGPDTFDCPHAHAARMCGCGFCKALNWPGLHNVADADSGHELVTKINNLFEIHRAKGELWTTVPITSAQWKELRSGYVNGRGKDFSHCCRKCAYPYNPVPGESEDCPACGHDGSPC